MREPARYVSWNCDSACGVGAIVVGDVVPCCIMCCRAIVIIIGTTTSIAEVSVLVLVLLGLLRVGMRVGVY